MPALDGVRALAVGAVLLFHGGVPWMRGGYLGISTFFTLSGFLISALLVRELDVTGRISLGEFWSRRLRRLLPAALLALALSGLLAALTAEPSSLPALRDDALATLLWLANWRFVASELSYLRILTAPSPLQHFWSLGVEMQFYVCFPLLLLLLVRLGCGSTRRLMGAFGALVLVSAGLAAWLLDSPEGFSRAYYGTDTRAAELLVGAMLGVWLARRSEPEFDETAPGRRHGTAVVGARAARGSPVVGLLALSVSMLAWFSIPEGAGGFFRGGQIVYSLATVCLLREAIEPGPLGRCLAWAPLRAVGRASYGLYVFHWPLFLWLDESRTGLSGGSLLGIRLLATGVVAGLSLRMIEGPVRRRVWFAGAHFVRAALAGVAAVAVLHVLVAAFFARPGLDAGDEPIPEAAPALRGERTVLGVGDSVARNLARGLATWGAGRGLRVVNGAFVGNGLAPAEDRRFAGNIQVPARSEDRIALWQEQLDRERPDVVILLPSVWDLVERRLSGHEGVLAPGEHLFDEWLVAEYGAVSERFAGGGRLVLWLTFPCPREQDWPGLLAESAALAPRTIDHLNARILPRVIAARPEDSALLPLAELVCPGGRFSSELAGRTNFRADGLHFRRADAAWVAEWLGPEVVRRLDLARATRLSRDVAPAADSSSGVSALRSERR